MNITEVKRFLQQIKANNFIVLYYVMETNLVVVEQETLKDLISDAVFAAMQDYKRREKATESIADASELPDAMTAEETLPFLASLGYRTTMRSLYILTHRHEIPYAKFGPRRLVFSRKELREWAAQQINRPRNRDAEAAQRIAESANRK